MNIETANRLLQFRKQHNLSQEELASKICVSRQAVSKWERAEASPDTDNLILLAEIYGVSLDELLKGEILNSEQEPTEEPVGTKPNPDSNTKYEKVDKVSFKNGIHVDSKDGDHVHLSFRDGIHVHDKDGTHVDIDNHGVFVYENGEQRVYTDENGNVMADECVINHHNKPKGLKIWDKFPFPIFALIAFALWGASGLCFGWKLSWIILLTIPLYYSLGDAIFKRNASHFAYPVLVAGIYILFGFFNVCGGWAFGWLILLTIPVYYWICELFKPKKNENSCDCKCNCEQ
ncbi:MAG: helix-turn-helix domain-containing protein [Oscillospiraceae bacterium]|nr:helix-turn-helix domain-containing protein [Oscillospiraceae bacterium]